MLNELKPARGEVRRRKRIGRGPGSGHGKTSTRGHKGQGSRSGGGVKPWFEGGQTPLFRRVPKRGFKNVFKKEYEVVNLNQLNLFKDGERVDKKSLKEKGLISKETALVKILARGNLRRKLEIDVDSASNNAIEKIKESGSTISIAGKTK